MNWGNFSDLARPPLQNQSCPFKRGPPERWPSGLRRTLGKRVCGKPYRGFESHSLRQLASEFRTSKHFSIRFKKVNRKSVPNEGLSNFARLESKRCIVCHAPIDEDKVRSKYFEIKIDNELQIRESQQLLKSKTLELENMKADLRSARREYSAALTDFSGRYDVANSPRESFLAERNKLVGKLEHELSFLEELRATLEKIDQLSKERAGLNDQIDQLEARLRSLQAKSTARTRKAMSSVSAIGRQLLKRDLPREDSFENPELFAVSFGDDAMLVDGKMNFAESSNVVLKNTAILSLFLAACYDQEFWHPRFLLMDNIEDKGMEQERSYNYQRLIVEESRKAKFAHQIIFTTSMMNPELEHSDLTVGPRYTRQNKTLR
jgi:hypothetical protein